MSAYFLFMGDKRAKVRQKNPDFKIGDIAKGMGKIWGEINVKDKDKYQKEADKLKIQYEKDKAAYEAGK